jgi:hypothetical protein
MFHRDDPPVAQPPLRAVDVVQRLPVFRYSLTYVGVTFLQT